MDTELFVRRQPGGMFAIINKSLTTGNIYWVDSGNSNAKNGDGSGLNPDAPFAGIDYAIGKCVADQGDRIYVMSGHAESVVAAGGITCDVADVQIIGLGRGADRPTITFDTDGDATIVMSAANVSFENFIFKNTKDGLVTGFPVTAAYCSFENCEFIDLGADNTLDWITLSTAADDFGILNCINKGTDTAGNQSFITIPATSNVQIIGLRSNGDFEKANIEFTAAGIDVLIADCYLENINAVDVNIEGYTALTGWIARNCCQIPTDTQTTWINTPGSVSLFENYGVNQPGETGKIIGTASI